MPEPGCRHAVGLMRFKVRHGVMAALAGFVLASAAAEAGAVRPSFHPSLSAASEAAAADQSLVLLIFGAEWCGPCKELKKQTISSPEFLEQGGGLHIAEVDIDANPKAAHDFAVDAVPTLVLLTADGKIVARQTGFLYTSELLLWLNEGRRRASAGQWEGTAPGVKFNEFLKQAATDTVSTNDIQHLVDLLGEPDPADRERAGGILVAQRDQAVSPLIEAVEHPYLGVRIAASELLQRLAPDAVSVDPWQSPVELSNTVATLRKWWAETGRLPPPAASRAADPSAENAIKAALDQLRGDDPVRRTEAMASLVGYGAVALPPVREAIKRAERSGDQRVIGWLEDVRWAVLVPDAVEQRAGGVRNALARGKSSDRQTAAEQLGRAGRDALGALTELVNDPDPLVVESALRALSGIGGKDAIPALVALLQVADNNLRMTAAQALGHTRSSEAIKPLLSVFGDPNEVVACTALGAVEEIRSQNAYGSSKRSLPEEVTAGLNRCLADSRWRVRAAAAEVIGKLAAADLSEELKKLLDDSDGFVVKSALTALGQLHAAPDPERLSALGKRLPSLRADTVQMMLESETDETVKIITDIFNSTSTDDQLAILNALARSDRSDEMKSDNDWKPLLTRATTATDPRLRRGAAAVLSKRAPKLAAELVGPLLADDDRETRIVAAKVVLGILDKQAGGPSGRNVFSSISAGAAGVGSKQEKTNKMIVPAERIASWHTALGQRPEPNPSLDFAAALYATGDGKADLPMLLRALGRADTGPAKQQQDLVAIRAVVSKLPWPEGQPVLDKLAALPRLFAMAAHETARAASEVAEYLLEPSRFRAAMERANGQALSDALELVAGYEYGERRSWSLWAETDSTKAIALALVDSTNAAWRAAAVFSLGLRTDANQSEAIFQEAIADSNIWVRVAAAQALARNTKDRGTLEQRLGPQLADANLHVAATAAFALLEPEVRQAAGLEDFLNYFSFENVRGGRNESHSRNDERPLSTLETKPAFLQQARTWLRATNTEETTAFVLLLAQYGEFEGVDRLIAQRTAMVSDKEHSLADALLAGIALSHDPKYLPTLRQMAAARHDEWDLRKVLQALRGMTGPDARQLRLEINKQMRSASGASGIPRID